MKMATARALLLAIAAAYAGVCLAQEAATAGAAASILSSYDQVPTVPTGLPTAGSTAADVLALLPQSPAGPAPTHALIVKSPPRYERLSRRAAEFAAATAAAAAAAGLPVLPVVVPPAPVATAAAADVAAESKVDKPLPRAVPSAAAVAAQAAHAADIAARDVATPQGAPSLYQGILDKHNYYRSLHGAPALTWSNSLASDAANYASQCQWGHDPSNANEGENLWAISVTGNSGQYLTQAIDNWYNEIKSYSWSYPGFSEATGHFTQVVWKSTTQLGCAVQACGSGFAGWSEGTYVVCRYLPPGNVDSPSYFQANVLPKGSAPAKPPPPPPPAPVPEGVLPQGYMVESPGCLVAANKLYWMCMQNNANLVLFNRNSKPIWTSGTAGYSNKGPMRLVMQKDGNLNIFDKTNRLLWTTNTANRGAAPRRFQVQNDGNALIADSKNKATWVTYTAGKR